MREGHRTLVVMRHARAEQSAPTDFERRLTDRGVADAESAGRWLAEQGIEPDAALVSAAARTIETWEAVAEAAGWELGLATFDEGLFAAGPESALDLIRETEDGIGTLVVIGHNPTMAYLAQLLDDGEGDDDVSAAMVTGFPTGALVVLDFDGDWAELDEAACSAVAFHVGRA